LVADWCAIVFKKKVAQVCNLRRLGAEKHSVFPQGLSARQSPVANLRYFFLKAIASCWQSLHKQCQQDAGAPIRI
jgi:hypothetical protein